MIPCCRASCWIFFRQLKDFEETLEASSLARKTAVFHLGKPLYCTPLQPTRKTPLSGKRWRTKSAPWPFEGERATDEVAGLAKRSPTAIVTHCKDPVQAIDSIVDGKPMQALAYLQRPAKGYVHTFSLSSAVLLTLV